MIATIMTMTKTTTTMMMMMMLLFCGFFSPFVRATTSPLSLPLPLPLPLPSTSTSLLASVSCKFPGRGGGAGAGGDGGGITDGDNVTAATSKKSHIVVRVRLMDGSIERIKIDADKLESVTLGDVLKPFDIDIDGDDHDIDDGDDSIRISINNSIVSTSSKTTTLQVLHVKHGSMITISPSPTAVKKKKMIDATTDDSSSRLAGANNRKKRSSTFSSFVIDTNKGDTTKIPNTWNPYPDLAKNYDELVRNTKRKRSSSMSSYSAISKLQSALHIVEPQKEGPLHRIYMCRNSAERFYSNGISTTTTTSTQSNNKKKSTTSKKKKTTTTNYNCRVGLLFGTIQQERVDRNQPKKARTSLSSATSDSEFCTVGKVQAVWEPPTNQQQKGDTTSNNKLYNTSLAQKLLAATTTNNNAQQQQRRVLLIAKYLGLTPIGWIFSYNDERLKDKHDQSIPKLGNNEPQALLGVDVAVSGSLQIHNMMNHHHKMKKSKNHQKNDDEVKENNNEEGEKFVTLAMDATTGATEAFQVSDVCVQMIYEDMFEQVFVDPDDSITTGIKNRNPPLVPMRHEVLIDGKETKMLDSVLCLVNTAMFDHVGSYSRGGSSSGSNSGSNKSSINKSTGSLTKKTKTKLAKALLSEGGDGDSSGDDGTFLELLSDFTTLVGLDQLLVASSSSKNDDDSNNENEIRMLCGRVRKWSRGQKQTTHLDATLKRKLLTYLE